jgi:hypothetical protein
MRLERTWLALDGLLVGNALGAAVFIPGDPESLHRRQLPPAPWSYTDDTVMALGITEVLQRHGRIDQEELAAN